MHRKTPQQHHSEHNDSLGAKKSLGQHFLNAPDVLRKMVESGNVSSEELVLEIGPGKGVLTQELLARGASVIAVEKDDRMIPFLAERFAKEIAEGKLVVIHGDVLNSAEWDHLTKGKKYKLIANIPYYITGAIFRLFFEHAHQPSTIVLLVQKEVAEQIIARDRKEGILSNSVKVYGDVRSGGVVKRGSFTPPPKVDSAIIIIENISKKNFDVISEQEFFTLLRAGFRSKRKILLNNISEYTMKPKEDIAKIFSRAGIDHKARAETLSIMQWKELVRNLSERT